MKKSDRPVYIISVAARLSEMHPQTLRIYERKGLLFPSRRKSRRLYSEADIERLKLIQGLSQEGISLAGVKRIIQLQEEIDQFQEMVEKLQAEMVDLRQEMENEIMMLHRKYSPKIEKVLRGQMVKVKIES